MNPTWLTDENGNKCSVLQKADDEKRGHSGFPAIRGGIMRYPATDWLDQPADPNEEQDEPRDPDCPTTAQYDADPGKYIWIRPFGNQFRVYTYDTEAADGYEIATIYDRPTMAEAEQAKVNYIAKIKPTPIGIAAVLDDIMRRFK